MLTIDDPEIERFIREEVERTGRTPVDVLRRFLPSSLATAASHATVVPPEEPAQRRAVIREVQESVGRLPVLDPRPVDELLGYDERGLPTSRNGIPLFPPRPDEPPVTLELVRRLLHEAE